MTKRIKLTNLCERRFVRASNVMRNASSNLPRFSLASAEEPALKKRQDEQREPGFESCRNANKPSLRPAGELFRPKTAAHSSAAQATSEAAWTMRRSEHPRCCTSDTREPPGS